MLQRDDVKAAWRWRTGPARKVVTRRKDDASLLCPADAGGRSAVRCLAALAHFDEHQCAIAVLHDKVDFAAAASRCPIIALQQLEPLRLQKLQHLVLRVIALGLAAGASGWHRLADLFLEEFH